VNEVGAFWRSNLKIPSKKELLLESLKWRSGEG